LFNLVNEQRYNGVIKTKFSANELNLLIIEKQKDGERSLRDIARESGISIAYLSLLRNGSKKNPGPKTMSKLCKYFNVTANELYETGKEGQQEANLTSSTIDLCEDLISKGETEKANVALTMLIEQYSSRSEYAYLYHQAVLLQAVALASDGKNDEAARILSGYISEDFPEQIKILAYYQYSRVLYRQGFFDEATDYAEEGLKLAERTNSQSIILKLHYILGIGYSRAAKHGKSILHYEKALEYFEEAGLSQQAHILFGLGQTYLFIHDAQSAKEYLQSSQEIYEQLANTKAVGDTKHNLSRCYFLTGKYDIAIELLHEALKLHKETKAVNGVAYDYLELARCAIKIGDLGTARDFATKATITFESVNNFGQSARSSLLHIEVLRLASENTTTQISMLLEIIDFFETHKWLPELARSLSIYAELTESTEGTVKANEAYKRAVNVYQSYIENNISTD
jgi:tetratricopeptide (TPR) repeat protein